MDGTFVNLETASAEQRFSLMLLERLEKLEKACDNFVVKPAPVEVPLASRESHRKLNEIYAGFPAKDLDVYTTKLQGLVPPNILSKVPVKLHKLFYNAIDLAWPARENAFTTNFAIVFLESFKEVDDEFIAWFNEHLSL
jgi:hypothetical protein